MAPLRGHDRADLGESALFIFRRDDSTVARDECACKSPRHIHLRDAEPALACLMKPNASAPAPSASCGQEGRLAAAGKYFTRDGSKVFLNGVSYGPFAPNSRGEPFPEDEQLARDFRHIHSLGFNAVRLYELPPDSVLDAARQTGLHLVIGIPWTDHVDFLSTSASRASIEKTIRDAAIRYGAHPGVAALLVGNEIEKTLVRWMGPREVRDFIEQLVAAAKTAAPQALVSYATYPSTEYLIPRNADFIAVNVYLEERPAWERYLQRLQNLAGDKPLVITEFGLDAHIHGEERQAEALCWQRESLLRAGAAGNVWFSYTDDWCRGGERVQGWHFGLVDRERRPRASCSMAAALPTTSAISGSAAPKITVIVCTRNGSRTLRPCLAAIARQSCTAHEVIVVDDGSVDDTPAVASSFSFVRLVRQEPSGLSVARNRGAHEATGEVLAFTDDDCIPDEDWLLHLCPAFTDPRWVAAGGPNIPPPPRNWIEAVVANAPGAPIHVLLNDQEAEHLPGCNFAVRKDALLGIGGFHSDFVTAGDDVDICWRLRSAGGRLRFVPAAMVWHHRRSTVRGYLRQQSGYGTAEALLMKHHPTHFGPLGGARWRGAIYGDGLGLLDPSEGSVFHGRFGLAPFQAIYPQGLAAWWELFTGATWVAAALIALGTGWLSVAGILLGFSIWAAWSRATRNSPAAAPGSLAERLLLWMLCWLQPIFRESARLRGMLRLRAHPIWRPGLPEIVIPARPHMHCLRLATLSFWSDQGVGREAWLESLKEILAGDKTPFREDDGWQRFDIEMNPGALVTWAFLTVSEHHGAGRLLTRVAVLERVSKWAALWLLAAALGLCLVIARTTLEFGWHAAIMPVAAVLSFFVGVQFLARVKAINLIHRAARRADMKSSAIDENGR